MLERACTGLSITAGYWAVWADRRTADEDPRRSEAEALLAAASTVRCTRPVYLRRARRHRSA